MSLRWAKCVVLITKSLIPHRYSLFRSKQFPSSSNDAFQSLVNDFLPATITQSEQSYHIFSIHIRCVVLPSKLKLKMSFSCNWQFIFCMPRNHHTSTFQENFWVSCGLIATGDVLAVIFGSPDWKRNKWIDTEIVILCFIRDQKLKKFELHWYF